MAILINILLGFHFLVVAKGAEYQTPSVTLDKCPTGFLRVSNGCYSFENSSRLTWPDANKTCANKVLNETTLSHLLVVDTLAEAIALSFWFKGNNYTRSYWTGGYFSTERSLWLWEWSKLPYVSNYQISDANIETNPNLYLFYNSTNQYDYRSDDGTKIAMNYICEAQVPCSPNENACFNNGSCYVNVGRVFCACLPGFTGRQCELLIDNCLSVPCLHGGDCTNLVNNYTCNCTKYYSGYSCEIANPDPLENLRNWVFYLCVSICLFLLGLLCMLDLPWIQIIGLIRHLFPTKIQRDVKKAAREAALRAKTPEYKELEDEKKKKQIDLIKSDVILNSEEEMLKRFKAALVQNKNRARGVVPANSNSPTEIDIDSRLSKRNNYKNDFF